MSALLLLALLGCQGDDDGPPGAAATADTGAGALSCSELTWDNTGQPFVSTWCTSCHSSDLEEGERFGAPLGLDFDSYEGLEAHASLVAASALGDDARMPPVGGADASERERFGAWLDCDLPGGPEPADADCEDAAAAAWGPEVCASGAPVRIEADVVAEGADPSCICEVDGSLTVTGAGSWDRLVRIGGDLRVEGASFLAPQLVEVGGVDVLAVPAGGTVDLRRLEKAARVSVAAPELVSLDLHDLEDVDGDVVIAGNAALGFLDLSRLESVGGSLVLDDNDALPAVLGELYGLRTVGGDLRIEGHLDWQGVYACGLLESVGGDVSIAENLRFVTLNGFTSLRSVGGDLRVVSNPALQFLEGFDQLTDVGGDLIVSGNAALTEEDAFALLERVDGQVVVAGNRDLAVVSGLVGIHDAGGVVWLDNPGLSQLTGYGALHTLRGELSVTSMAGLQGIDGFDALAAMTGSLILDGNDALQEVEGFGALREVSGSVEVLDHAQLTDLAALTGIVDVGADLRLVDNASLSVGGLQPWLSSVQVAGEVEIVGNAP